MDGVERLLTVLTYVMAAAVILVAGLVTGFAGRDLTTVEVAAIVCAGVPALFLLINSLFGLVSYFVFLPSVKKHGHLFAHVHGTHIIHPLTTSIVLALLCLCIFSGNLLVWGTWLALLGIYLVLTALIVRRTREEHLMNGTARNGNGLFMLLLNLIFGGELVTIAAGARPLAPWRLNSLPEDTWIVDVRTKPEFHWNRMQGAESYPWGVGVIEAAKDKSKEKPVLVTCLSGHRSNSVAVMLRRLGFKNVYNLNWGLLYLIILQRGHHTAGAFGLTRPHREPQKRGEDLRGITHAYVTLALLAIIGSPLEMIWLHRQPSMIHMVVGAALVIIGGALGASSFVALGRNFRVYMAPRRSGTLVTGGIYSWVRHPMYTGTISLVSGFVVFFGSWFFIPAAAGVAILYLIKAAKEERLLVEKYPEYGAYSQRTWAFIPYIY